MHVYYIWLLYLQKKVDTLVTGGKPHGYVKSSLLAGICRQTDTSPTGP